MSDSNFCSEPVSYAAVKEDYTSGLVIEVFDDSGKVGADVVLQTPKKDILVSEVLCPKKIEEEQQLEGIPTGERLDHCETRKSDYCPRPFRKMPHRGGG